MGNFVVWLTKLVDAVVPEDQQSTYYDCMLEFCKNLRCVFKYYVDQEVVSTLLEAYREFVRKLIAALPHHPANSLFNSDKPVYFIKNALTFYRSIM